MREESPRITFITIATGRYLDFWKQQIDSAKIYLDSELCIEFVILTDNPESIASNIFADTSWKLRIARVEHGVWPYPTLYKFRYILKNKYLINSDFVWHLDADMLFGSHNVLSELISAGSSDNVVLVQHPGYYRPKFKLSARIYFRNSTLLLRDLKILIKYGAIGTWDLNKKSKAYVERKMREKYFCGGSWGGSKSSVLNMCEELEGRICHDIDQNYMAEFHDESHINWYGANRVHEELEPSYCYEQSYKFLYKVSPKIIAVNKNKNEVWSRTD